jgi:hypothetical protein
MAHVEQNVMFSLEDFSNETLAFVLLTLFINTIYNM